jgi:hypothetical protein
VPTDPAFLWSSQNKQPTAHVSRISTTVQALLNNVLYRNDLFGLDIYASWTTWLGCITDISFQHLFQAGKDFVHFH